MSGRRIVFIDRDGTLIEEPADEQVDALAKIRLMPGVIAALQSLQQAGFGLVMVTNQDGLGTASLPLEAFETAQQFVLNLFHSQGIDFEAVFVCPHFKTDQCDCRKPKTGLVDAFFAANAVDRGRSYMVGDRDTDLQFANNLGIAGLRVLLNGAESETWPRIAATIRGEARRAAVHRKTKETMVDVSVDLSREGPSVVSTGLGFFDHMLEQIAKHGGFALQLRCQGDLHIDEHHTIEDCALGLGSALRQALGDKVGIARYGFLLAMDEAEAQVALDLSGRAFFVWEGKFNRERVGELPTELVPHFFRSLAETLGAALHISVHGENSHHMIESCFKGVGRSLRQAIRIEGSELPSTKGTLVSDTGPHQVVIIPSGGANTASLQFALQRLGVSSEISADAAQIRAASHVILPGVGAAADAMRRLCANQLEALIPTLRQPVLGICLGMQLLYETSEEGGAVCLGVIPGSVRRFAEAAGRPVPHMGWNTLMIERHSALLEGVCNGDYAYFVHSYAVTLREETIASTEYGAPFSACVQWNNFYGAQFHPERSAAVGARVLNNFLSL